MNDEHQYCEACGCQTRHRAGLCMPCEWDLEQASEHEHEHEHES